MSMSEADTRANLIDPVLRDKGWTQEYVKREETARGARNLSGTATSPRCTSGGHGDRWPAEAQNLEPHLHTRGNVDTRTPEELLYIIEAKSREVHEALAIFRTKTDGGK